MAMTWWAGEARISPTVEKDSGEGDWAGSPGEELSMTGQVTTRWGGSPGSKGTFTGNQMEKALPTTMELEIRGSKRDS